MADASNPINVAISKGKEILSFNPDDLSDAAYRHLLELGAKAYLNSRMSKITIAALKDEATVKSEAMLRANENLEKLVDPDFKSPTKGAKASKVTGAVKTEAMRLARNIIKDEIKRSGGKIAHYPTAEITAAAKELLEQNDSILETAKANVEARTALAVGEGDKLSAITKKIKTSDVLVKKAEAKRVKAKADKPLSAKQAGMTTKAKPKAQLNA